MPAFHHGFIPDIVFHGTDDRMSLIGPCIPAARSRWWTRIPWRTYANDFGQARMAYANIVWDGLGLAVRGRPQAPEWARRIRSFRQLAERIGLLFVTDDATRAGRLYGPVVEIDMTHPSILDAVIDPNALTHNAWILILKAGEPLPLLFPEPYLRTGWTRLYRGETDLPGETRAIPDWIAENGDFQKSVEATGCWFVKDRTVAEYYNHTFGDKTGRVSYIDVPTLDVEKYLSAHNPEARRFSALGCENDEYFVPRSLAESRKPLSGRARLPEQGQALRP